MNLYLKTACTKCPVVSPNLQSKGEQTNQVYSEPGKNTGKTKGRKQ